MKEMNDKLALTSVYKSPKHDEMYLYVDKRKGMSDLPAALLEHFGKPVHIMDILLSRKKSLARVDIDKVKAEIAEKGFYLQMPPPREKYMLNLYKDRFDQNRSE